MQRIIGVEEEVAQAERQGVVAQGSAAGSGHLLEVGGLFAEDAHQRLAPGGVLGHRVFGVLGHALDGEPQQVDAVARREVEFQFVQANAESVARFLYNHIDTLALDEAEIEALYRKYSPEKFNLQDRGYIARVHPLELWLIGYLHRHPAASVSEVIKAGAAQRQAVYNWLFKTRRKNKQDIRIRTLLEIEAFGEIHQAWKRLGYPFDSLVPSYATAIGSSADRPAALAELMGILVNNGRRLPIVRFTDYHFAAGTPYEAHLLRPASDGVM